jgi:hypothetical protein
MEGILFDKKKSFSIIRAFARVQLIVNLIFVII